VTKKAIQALVIFFILVTAYISIRFNSRWRGGHGRRAPRHPGRGGDLFDLQFLVTRTRWCRADGARLFAVRHRGRLRPIRDNSQASARPGASRTRDGQPLDEPDPGPVDQHSLVAIIRFCLPSSARSSWAPPLQASAWPWSSDSPAGRTPRFHRVAPAGPHEGTEPRYITIRQRLETRGDRGRPHSGHGGGHGTSVRARARPRPARRPASSGRRRDGQEGGGATVAADVVATSAAPPARRRARPRLDATGRNRHPHAPQGKGKGKKR